MKGLQVYPALDPNIDVVSRQIDSQRKTLTHWRRTDYFFHARVLATPPPFGDPWRLRLYLGPEISLLATPTVNGDYPLTENDVLVFPPAPETVLAPKERAVQTKTKSRARVYARVEGQNLPTMEWSVPYLREFDGLYFPPSETPAALLQQMIFGVEHGNGRPLHFASVQGEERLSVLALMAYQREISFDTAVHLSGTALMYFPPYEVNHGVRLIKGPKQLTTLPCDCPVCVTASVNTLYESAPHRNLHNLYQVIRAGRIHSSIQQNREWYVHSYMPNRVRELVPLWDIYQKDGYDAAFRRSMAVRLPRGQKQLIEPEYQAAGLRQCAFCEAEASRTRYGHPVCRECDSYYDMADRAVGVPSAIS